MSNFDGTWRVHEHVFSPDGEYRGRVVQTRRLVPSAHSRVRVIQDCEPEPTLDDGPMARFRGHHEFDLTVDGHLRRYEGPAVIGTGLALGDTAMVGRGVWPGFGYSFTSYSAMVGPRCQLTGGTFYLANRPVAVVVGQAVLDGDVASDVSRPTWPGNIGRHWRGRRLRFSAAGALQDTVDVQREYLEGGFRECGGPSISLEPWTGGFRVARGEGRQRAVGTAVQNGCSLSVDLHGLGAPAPAGGHAPESQDWLELLEPRSRTLISVRRVFRAQQLDRIELHELAVEQEPA